MGSRRTKKQRQEDDARIESLSSMFRQQAQDLGPTNPVTLATALDLGAFYRDLGEFDEAADLFGFVVQGQRETIGAQDLETIRSLFDLSNALFLKGDYSEAAIVQQEVLERVVELFGPQSIQASAAMFNLVATYLATARLDEALILQRSLVVANAECYGAQDWETLKAMWGEADLLRRLSRHDEARTIAEQSLAMAKDANLSPVSILDLKRNLLRIEVEQDDWVSADSLADEIFTIDLRELEPSTGHGRWLRRIEPKYRRFSKRREGRFYRMLVQSLFLDKDEMREALRAS